VISSQQTLSYLYASGVRVAGLRRMEFLTSSRGLNRPTILLRLNLKQSITFLMRVVALAATAILLATTLRPGVGEPFNISAEMTEVMSGLLPPELHTLQRSLRDERLATPSSPRFDSISIPENAIRKDADQRYVIRIAHDIAQRVNVQVVSINKADGTIKVIGLNLGDVIVSQPRD
jgi:hypothetical protein